MEGPLYVRFLRSTSSLQEWNDIKSLKNPIVCAMGYKIFGQKTTFRVFQPNAKVQQITGLISDISLPTAHLSTCIGKTFELSLEGTVGEPGSAMEEIYTLVVYS